MTQSEIQECTQFFHKVGCQPNFLHLTISFHEDKKTHGSADYFHIRQPCYQMHSKKGCIQALIILCVLYNTLMESPSDAYLHYRTVVSFQSCTVQIKSQM